MKVFEIIRWTQLLEIERKVQFGGNYAILEDGKVINKYGRKLRGSIDAKGYVVYTLADTDGNHHKVMGHQIVAQYYHNDTMTTGKSVDHIDRNRENNDKGNLRWATPAEQMANKNDFAYILYLENLLIENNIEY